jgi:hypothetical protein
MPPQKKGKATPKRPNVTHPTYLNPKARARRELDPLGAAEEDERTREAMAHYASMFDADDVPAWFRDMAAGPVSHGSSREEEE